MKWDVSPPGRPFVLGNVRTLVRNKAQDPKAAHLGWANNFTPGISDRWIHWHFAFALRVGGPNAA